MTGLLLSEDGQRALVVLPVRDEVRASDAVAELEDFLAGRRDGLRMLLGGPLVAETQLGLQVLRDLAVLVPLMLALVAFVLFAMLRSIGGVLIPLLETGLVLVWTFGAMGWSGAPVALVSTILPVVLMAMAITDEIHLLERLEAQSAEIPLRERLEQALAEVGRPIVLTSLTTAAGFASFITASIGPLREFGIFAAFGILVAMLLTFTLIPAAIVLMGPRAFDSRRAVAGRGLGPQLARRRGLGFAAASLVVAACAAGVTQLRVGDSWAENFAPDADVVRAERAINESFWGSYRYDVVLEGIDGLFRSPAGLALVEAVRAGASGAPHVGGVQSLLDPLRDLASPVGADPQVWTLNQRELFDLFTLAEMSDSPALGRLVSADAGATRLRLYVKHATHGREVAIESALAAWLPATVAPLGVEAHASGDLPLASALVEAIVSNQLRSIGWALALVAGLLILFSRRVSALLALLPVVATLGALFGLMGWSGLELGIATSMFASLAVGVGVDYGIHFLHRFELEREAGRSPHEAVGATVDTVGRALFWNALVLGAGFGLLTVSSMPPNHRLGLLLAGAALGCWAATLLLLPFLLVRGRGPGGAAVLLLLAAGLTSTPTARAEICQRRDDPAATDLMTAIEQAQRGRARIARLEIAVRYHQGSRLAEVIRTPMAPKTIWSAIDGSANPTWLLYVFTGPGRMAGTTLLIRDFAGAERTDDTWFYLRAFEHFEKLEGAVERAVIPGTVLTYEDARGFIASDRYHFAFAPDAPSGRRRVQGCPRSDAVAERMGYGAIEVDVDPERLLVERVAYRDLAGAPLKDYTVTAATALGGLALPASATLIHHAQPLTNELRYEYWRPAEPLPPGLFHPELSEGRFLDRMQEAVRAVGLGDRFDAEVEAAELRVRAWEEKHGQPPP